MTELTLRGVHDDEEHLVLVDGAGAEYLLPIDESLFAAVRRDRSHLSRLRAAGEAVRPRDIQAMIRSGMTADEVAEATGATLEHVQAYEGPVLAERAHTAARAGDCLVYPDNDPSGSPKKLLTLCRERLAMRDVDLSTMAWDAWKTTRGTWYVELAFTAADRRRTAGWDFARGSISPLDDEARWLSDAGPSDSGPIPNFGSGAERVYNIESDQAQAPAAESTARGDHAAETGRILEGLRRRRGKHAAPPIEHDGPTFDAHGGAGAHSGTGAPGGRPEELRPAGFQVVPTEPEAHPDGAHTALSAPDEATDDSVLPLGDRQDRSARTSGADVPAPAAPTSAPMTPESDEAPHGPAPDGAPAAETAPEQAAAPRTRREQRVEPQHVDPDQPSLLDEPGVYESRNDTQPVPRPDEGEAHRGRKGRSSVPSWDEIMFGSKRD